MWVLMISQHGGYKFHSAHMTREKCESWRDCKEEDGEHCSILTLTTADKQSLLEILEAEQAQAAKE